MLYLLVPRSVIAEADVVATGPSDVVADEAIAFALLDKLSCTAARDPEKVVQESAVPLSVLFIDIREGLA
jgi:hypothetical protein